MGIDGWGRVYYDFYIHDLRSERILRTSIPRPGARCVCDSRNCFFIFFSCYFVFHLCLCFSLSAEWNASIKRATLAAASRQTANQSQQQISPAQITLIVPNGKYPPYLHLSHSANYWTNYAKPGQRTCWHSNGQKR